MEVLKEAVLREISQRYNERLKKIKTTEGLKQTLSFEGKEYKGDEVTQREKLKKYLINRQNKEKATQLNQIEEVSKAEVFKEEFIITIEWKDRELNKYLEAKRGRNNTNGFNREVLGYGSGYNVLPRFEGGVGINSHNTIIENLGLKWKKVTDTPSTDVYLITK